MSGKTRSTTFTTSTKNSANIKDLSHSFAKAGPNSYISRAASDIKGGDIEMDAMNAAALRDSSRAIEPSDGESRIGEAV